MFTLIFGKDTYRAWQKFKEIIQEFREKAKIGLSLDFLNSDKMTFEDFKNELKHSSMFEKEKIVALRNVFLNPEFKNRFFKEAKNFVDDENLFVVFFEEKETSITDDLQRFFKKYGRIYEFVPLESPELSRWAKREIANLGKTIAEPALNLLLNSVGSDLWRMSAEIKKLVAYKSGSDIIESKDVELLVKPAIETAIFKTIDAIAKKDKKTALKLLYNHLEKGDSPLYLLSMIIYQFRNLLLVKDFETRPISEITAALKPMHPFVVKKSVWLARKFSLEQLEEIYLKLFKTDLAVKTGKIKPELALELLIADI